MSVVLKGTCAEEEMILGDMLLELNDSCEQDGMKINANKTKSMVIGRKVKKVYLRIPNEAVEQVNSFECLGCTSLMLEGSEFHSLGRAIVEKDEYEEVRWDGIVSIVSCRERVFRLWWEESGQSRSAICYVTKCRQSLTSHDWLPSHLQGSVSEWHCQGLVTVILDVGCMPSVSVYEALASLGGGPTCFIDSSRCETRSLNGNIYDVSIICQPDRSRLVPVAWQQWSEMEALIPSPSACEVRSVIKFFNAQSIAPIEIHRQLCQVYGPNITSKQVVRRWCRQFSEVRQSVHDEERSGRPSLINDDRVELVHHGEPSLHDYGAEQPFSADIAILVA
ncbi:hypothetical protein ANN_00545 [Periplaneta americana]|uniref:Mos1 transposase HTH domain-containing protein n=1 Tax=Periplaneta americana TaxID=6978 RepID=A0ABQ8TU06_PERAM|nr:hypothetical protein ANN_00545 [Periplaneta americana]